MVTRDLQLLDLDVGSNPKFRICEVSRFQKDKRQNERGYDRHQNRTKILVFRIQTFQGIQLYKRVKGR